MDEFILFLVLCMENLLNLFKCVAGFLREGGGEVALMYANYENSCHTNLNGGLCRRMETYLTYDHGNMDADADTDMDTNADQRRYIA